MAEIKMTIRFPKEIKVAFEKKAKEDDRSINAQLLVLVKEYLKLK
jgi:hypothetical protein